MKFEQCGDIYDRFVIHNEKSYSKREYLAGDLTWEKLPWPRCIFYTIAEVQNAMRRREHLDKLGENRI